MVEIDEIIRGIQHYESERGQHASGTFGKNVLEKIAELSPPIPTVSVETGCGKSTILFSHLSKSHVCYTVDNSMQANGSLNFVKQCPLLRSERVRFLLGPTQLTMATSPPSSTIDAALIDGPHAYPFPELEYYYLYPKLRTNALLIIDDLHIPTIARMYEFLCEDAMFDELHIEDHTGFLRRTDAPIFPPTWDCWNEQNYNRVRFPAHVQKRG